MKTKEQKKGKTKLPDVIREEVKVLQVAVNIPENVDWRLQKQIPLLSLKNGANTDTKMHDVRSELGGG